MHWHCCGGCTLPSRPWSGAQPQAWERGARVPHASVCCHLEMRVGPAHDGWQLFESLSDP